MKEETLCHRCDHCITIDVNGNVDCSLHHHGKAKVFCRDFFERFEERQKKKKK